MPAFRKCPVFPRCRSAMISAFCSSQKTERSALSQSVWPDTICLSGGCMMRGASYGFQVRLQVSGFRFQGLLVCRLRLLIPHTRYLKINENTFLPVQWPRAFLHRSVYRRNDRSPKSNDAVTNEGTAPPEKISLLQ